MPDEWIGAVDVEMLGQLAAEHEGGEFTTNGYILPSGDEWQRDFEDDRRVPDEYRLTGKEEKTHDKPSIKEQLKAGRELADKTPEAKPKSRDFDLS